MRFYTGLVRSKTWTRGATQNRCKR